MCFVVFMSGVLPYTDKVFAVPSALVDQHIKIASEAQLKVLLYLLRHADNAFSEEDIDDYWKNKFSDLRIGTYAYSRAFKSCLEFGFSLQDLVSWTNFDFGSDPHPGSGSYLDASSGSSSVLDPDPASAPDGDNRYLDFISEVMDAQLHVAEKDCSDVLTIDSDDPGLYGVETQLANAFFGVLGGLRNKRVNRYVPVETIRSVLKDVIGDHVDVDSVINSRLAAEQESAVFSENADRFDEAKRNRTSFSSDEFNIMVNEAVSLLHEEAEQYDISRFEELAYFKRGDSVAPRIAKSLEAIWHLMSELIEERDYQELIDGTWKARCECLARNDVNLLLTISDWERIFDEVKDNDESFARYYLAVRIKITTEDMRDVVTAFARNDDLYEYVKMH